MCGRIIQNKRVIIPGNSLVTIIEGLRIPKVFGIPFNSGVVYNARKETWHQKWEPYGWLPCKIPIEGFYEKTTLFEGEILIGGLYKQNNCLILTVEANQQVKRVHHRMPFILN